jgi:hypothetical protein
VTAQLPMAGLSTLRARLATSAARMVTVGLTQLVNLAMLTCIVSRDCPQKVINGDLGVPPVVAPVAPIV